MGLALSLAVLMSAAAILLRLTRVLVGAFGRRLPVSFRHGFAGTFTGRVLIRHRCLLRSEWGSCLRSQPTLFSGPFFAA